MEITLSFIAHSVMLHSSEFVVSDKVVVLAVSVDASRHSRASLIIALLNRILKTKLQQRDVLSLIQTKPLTHKKMRETQSYARLNILFAFKLVDSG